MEHLKPEDIAKITTSWVIEKFKTKEDLEQNKPYEKKEIQDNLLLNSGRIAFYKTLLQQQYNCNYPEYNYPSKLVWDGTYLYVGYNTNPNYKIIKLNPLTMRKVGEYQGTGKFFDMTTDTSYLYVCENYIVRKIQSANMTSVATSDRLVEEVPKITSDTNYIYVGFNTLDVVIVIKVNKQNLVIDEGYICPDTQGSCCFGIVYTEGFVYFITSSSTGNAKLVCLNANTMQLIGMYIDNGKVFEGVAAKGNIVYVIQKNLETGHWNIKKFKEMVEDGESSLMFNPLLTICYDGMFVFVGAEDNKIYRFDSQLNRTTIKETSNPVTSLCLADTLYAGDNTGKIFNVNPLYFRLAVGSDATPENPNQTGLLNLLAEKPCTVSIDDNKLKFFVQFGMNEAVGSWQEFCYTVGWTPINRKVSDLGVKPSDEIWCLTMWSGL